ncbi:two-component regulator propeller domain-containing protein, partial [Bacteroidota bacterium]
QKKCLKKSASLVFFILFSFSPVSSQNNIKFKHISAKDGLSQSYITRVFNDSYGYMWFGTGSNGLNKYDGTNFIFYESDPDDKNSIRGSVINFIYEDKNKDLWIGTSPGFSIYNRELDYFQPFSYFDEMLIINLYELDNGKFYLTTTNEFILFDPKNNSAIILANGEQNNIGTINKNTLLEYKNELLIGTQRGLYHFDTSSYQLTPVYKNVEVHSIAIDNENRIWIGTFSNGLLCLTFEHNDYSKPVIKNFIHNPDNINSISRSAILALQIDNNNLWIGLENDGVDILDLNNFNQDYYNFTHNKHRPYDNYSISYNSIWTIYKDNEGTVWVGTTGGGVNYYSKSIFKFGHYKHIPGNNNSISNDHVNEIYEEGDDLWIGTEVGLDIINTKNNNYQHFKYEDNNSKSLGSSNVRSIYRDSRNNMWIGAWAGGLNLFNEKTKTFTRFLHDPNNASSINNNNVVDIVEDDKGILWIATMGGGINRFDYRNNVFKSYNQDMWIKELLISDYGELWLAGSNGAVKFDIEKEEFHSFTFDTDDKKSISSNNLVTIFEDSKSNIWLGTDKGLNLFNRDSGNFTLYNKKEGLPNDVIRGICEDDHGNLWISSNKGISKFINAINCPESPVFENFDKDDGLQGNEFKSRSYFKSKDGKLYFGGTNGYNVFHPDSLKKNSNLPGVIFTNLLIFNKSVKIGEENSPLTKHISLTKELIFKHHQSVVTFEYSAFNYLAPDKTQYAFIMEGFEKEWNYVKNKTDATYTNLDPGEYTFRVKASNSDGLWNEEGTLLKIKILPPWWQTWGFRISLFVFIIGSAIAFYYYRVNALKERQKELEIKVEKRTAELKERQEEILAQNEEIQQQAEELQAQRDTLSEKNIQIEKAYESIRVLSDFGQKITSTLNIDAINNMIYEYVSSLMDTSAFGIGLYNEEKEIIEFHSFFEKGKKLPYFKRSTNNKQSLSIWCLKNKKEVFINDTEEEYSKYIDQKPKYQTSVIPRSLIAIPLLIEDKTIGIITINSSNKNSYTQNDLTNLRSLASYISIALDNANVYEVVNKQNVHIKSSIEYAKTIQNSILPIEKNIKKYFEFFILYKPKDIVSGDFYWFLPTTTTKGAEKIFMGAVDCTGHGVPGAFMSLIGYRLLNEIVNEKKIYNPAQILEFLNVGVQLALKQDQTANNDGMDVCICCVENQNDEAYKIEFSGAKLPLFIKHKNKDKIERISGSRKSIGGVRSKRSKLYYEKNELLLNKGDIIYLSTDGIIDQHSPDRKRLGTNKLINILKGVQNEPLDKQKELIDIELKAHMQGEEQRDDITFMGIRL